MQLFDGKQSYEKGYLENELKKKKGLKRKANVIGGGDSSRKQDRQILNLMKFVVQRKGHKDKCGDHWNGVLPWKREVGINTEYSVGR